MMNSVSISHATELISHYHVIRTQSALCCRRTTLIRNDGWLPCGNEFSEEFQRTMISRCYALTKYLSLATLHIPVADKMINFECRKRMRTVIPFSRLMLRNEKETSKWKLEWSQRNLDKTYFFSWRLFVIICARDAKMYSENGKKHVVFVWDHARASNCQQTHASNEEESSAGKP